MPAVRSVAQLVQLTGAYFPRMIDVGTLTTPSGIAQLWVDLPEDDPTPEMSWATMVALHAPIEPTPEQVAVAQAVNEAELRVRLSERIDWLEQILDYPDVPNMPATVTSYPSAPDVAAIPAGTFTTAQLSDGLRAIRADVQANRAAIRELATVTIGLRVVAVDHRSGIKWVAQIVRDVCRYLRRDFGTVD